MRPYNQPRNETESRRRTRQRININDSNVFTWNVVSLYLYRTGTTRILLDVLNKYKADVTAIQEVRWTGNGVKIHDATDKWISIEFFWMWRSKYA